MSYRLYKGKFGLYYGEAGMLVQSLMGIRFRTGNSSLATFDTWLREDPDQRDDRLWILSEGHLDNIHDVVDVHRHIIAMRYWPEELIIVSR